MRNETNRERLWGFGLLVSLLVLAGSTASVVAYRIKSREWQTRSQLEATYKRIHPINTEPIIVSKNQAKIETAEQKFVVAYEFNQLVKGFGLLRALEGVEKEKLPLVISVLNDFDKSVAGSVTKSVVEKIQEGTPQAELRNLARRYNRPETRRLERELYSFVQQQSLK